MTSIQAPNTPSAPTPTPALGAEVDAQRERLLALRAQLARERERAISPAVDRALEMADTYLFLGLGYVGHVDEMFPGEHRARPEES